MWMCTEREMERKKERRVRESVCECEIKERYKDYFDKFFTERPNED